MGEALGSWGLWEILGLGDSEGTLLSFGRVRREGLVGKFGVEFVFAIFVQKQSNKSFPSSSDETGAEDFCSTIFYD